MQSFIYKSLKKDYLYLYLVNRDDFSKVPEELLNNFGKLEFVMEIELTEDKKLAKEEAKKVIESLNTKGFFIQLPPQKELN
ncbi:MAG: YcgL domain-containing protein [Methylococcales bacterium]|nr:MAG: YcgL domain-containing protein [Methylococcales bacterium]